MFGISFSNATSVIAAWGGAKHVIGNNPFSFASPYKDNQPIIGYIDEWCSRGKSGSVC